MQIKVSIPGNKEWLIKNAVDCPECMGTGIDKSSPYSHFFATQCGLCKGHGKMIEGHTQLQPIDLVF